MSLGGPLYLGWCYLRGHRGRTALVVAAVTLSLFLPLAVWQVVGAAEVHLRARSAATPLLMGAKGSPLELVFNALYFAEPNVERVTMADVAELGSGRLAEVIPLYARFEARGYRVVGTTLNYFTFRGLRFGDGRAFGRLGDCVLGADVAGALGLGVGDAVVTTPEGVFDLAGVYPLKLNITGILAPRGTADDAAVFTDVKTAWVVEGLAHGHDPAAAAGDTVLTREGNNVALNASVVEYAEVTDQNIGTFHFHGDPGTFPVTAAIAVPQDGKAETILLGRYVGGRRAVQLIRPDDTMATLFATVFRVRDLVVVTLAALALASFAVVAMLLVLTHRLRAGEFRSLRLIGASPGALRLLVLFEAGAVVLAGAAAAGVLLISLRAVLAPLLRVLV